MPAETVEAPVEGKPAEEPVEGATAAPSAVPAPETPAPADGEKPEGEQQPSPDDGLPDLTPEQLAKINQRYGADLRKLPEVQQEIQQTAQQLAREQAMETAVDPFRDETFQQIVREYDDHGKALAETLPEVATLVQRLKDGEDVDPADLGKKLEKAVTTAARQRDLAVAASDHRAVAMIDGLVDVLWPEEAETTVGKGHDGKPIGFLTAWESVLAGYDSLRSSDKPEVRAKAAGWFAQTALPIIYNLGVTKGIAHGQSQAARQQQPKLQAEHDGALAEALAKLGAAHPAMPAGGEPPRSDAEVLADPTTPVSKLMEIRARQRNGG